MAVTYIGAGAGVASISDPISVAYPASILADDLIILQFAQKDNTGNVPSATGFTLLHTDEFDGNLSQFILYKVAVGSESGNLSVNHPAAASVGMARMYLFRGNLTASIFEDPDTLLGTDASVEAPSVTTSLPGGLAVAFVALGDQNTIGPFTGESGGDWTEPVAEFSTGTGSNGAIQLQTAAMASAGTISGGAVTQSAADPWGVRSFGIKPLIVAGGLAGLIGEEPIMKIERKIIII